MSTTEKSCYVDGTPCDCGGFDVCGDCPKDTFVYTPEEEVEEQRAEYERLDMDHRLDAASNFN